MGTNGCSLQATSSLGLLQWVCLQWKLPFTAAVPALAWYWVLLMGSFDGITYIRVRNQQNQVPLKLYHLGTCSITSTHLSNKPGYGVWSILLTMGFSLSYKAPNSHLEAYIFCPTWWKCTNMLQWGQGSEVCREGQRCQGKLATLASQEHKEGERVTNTHMTFVMYDLCSLENTIQSASLTLTSMITFLPSAEEWVGIGEGSVCPCFPMNEHGGFVFYPLCTGSPWHHQRNIKIGGKICISSRTGRGCPPWER